MIALLIFDFCRNAKVEKKVICEREKGEREKVKGGNQNQQDSSTF